VAEGYDIKHQGTEPGFTVVQKLNQRTFRHRAVNDGGLFFSFLEKQKRKYQTLVRETRTKAMRVYNSNSSSDGLIKKPLRKLDRKALRRKTDASLPGIILCW